MMNNKGQVAVVFIIILPILLIVLGMLTDIGYTYIEKRKVDNVIKDTITYGFDHITDDQVALKDNMEDLIDSNIKNIATKEIMIDVNYIKITINKETNGLFGRILNKELYHISSSYYGYIENDELKIIKE